MSVVDYTPAFEKWRKTGDPDLADVPFQPSYEHRHGVPDRGFDWTDEVSAERLHMAWREVLTRAAERGAALLHLHHLGVLQIAANGIGVPYVSHLHGTELKFVERVLSGEAGPHGRWWVDRMREGAASSARVVCISEHDRRLALDLLGLGPSDVEVVPNGVDTEVFRPRAMPSAERLAFWRRVLVDDPRGWDETGRVGSVRYGISDLDVFGTASDPSPVIIFVGRFLAFKRLPVLLEAFAEAQRSFSRRIPLVVWGGSPGEWEGEHPVTYVRRRGIRDVFFVGWRGHEDLPTALAASDVFVAPSVGEPFGQVYLEAMACGLPVIACASGGPLEIVETDSSAPTGWLVTPDDVGELASAMLVAVEDAEERSRRGRAAEAAVRRRWSWHRIAGRFISVYEQSLLAT